jgi:hypothetical protein
MVYQLSTTIIKKKKKKTEEKRKKTVHIPSSNFIDMYLGN